MPSAVYFTAMGKAAKKNDSRNSTIFICLALSLVTLAVYRQVGHYDFINLDDYGYVKNNPNVNQGFTAGGIKEAFRFSGYASNWHPLTWLSHMLDCQLFTANPGPAHMTNVLFHIANTLLLFIVLKKMTSAFWQSAFVAALFALHPLHVESVAWISERKDVLSTFFWILTMLAYWRYTKQPKTSAYLLTVLLFILGLTAKPMLVTLPFVLLLLDYWPLQRLQKQTAPRLVFEKIPFFALSAASSVITFIVQRKAGSVVETDLLPLNLRIANTSISYIRYITKMFFPKDLAIFYPHLGTDLSMSLAIVNALLLLLITACIIYFAQRHRYLLLGWLWYLGTLVPVIGLVQVGGLAMADRYTYIPLTGLFIIIAWGANDLLIKYRYRKRILSLSAAAIISVLSVCTFHQVGYWQNSISLFGRAVEVTKDNYAAHKCLADAFYEQGNTNLAIKHYKAASQIHDYPPAHANLGIILMNTGEIDQAIIHLKKAIQYNLPQPRLYAELARAMVGKGKMTDAIGLYEKALELEPDSVVTINALAWHLATYNDDNIRDPQKAVQLAQRACELTDYKQPELLDTLAAAYAAVGNFDKAIELTQSAIQLCRPDKHKMLIKEFKSRLILYKAKKPYIEIQ